MDQRRSDSDGGNFVPPFSPASVAGMMAKFFDMVTRAVTGHGTGSSGGGTPPGTGETPEPAGGSGVSQAPPSRPVLGYINTGIYKVERLRAGVLK